MNYLLDTNTCIYIIKRKPISVFEKLNALAIGTIAISSITVAELEYGVKNSAYVEKNRHALLDFLSPMTILDFDYPADVEYGNIRKELETKGTPIGSMDLLIAAHAKSQNLVLVTNNEREFVRIKDLNIQNWVVEE